MREVVMTLGCSSASSGLTTLPLACPVHLQAPTRGNE